MVNTMTDKKEKTTDVAEVKESQLAVCAMNFEEDAGVGLENADKDSFAIPFISLLQGLSPQLETVEGAKPGLFINSITNELYAKVLVIPCAYQRRFLRWSPRASGGGFKGEYSPIDVETGSVVGLSQHNGQYLMDVQEGVAIFDKDGHAVFDHLSDTRNHFVLVQSISGAWQPALISLSSTQVKASKRWMSRIQGVELRNSAGKAFNPPSFSHVYELSSVKQENAKGKWHGYEVNMVGAVEDAETYVKAKEFHASVTSGSVSAAPPTHEETGSGVDGGDVNKF
jgi:hypothetical protein